MIVIYIIINLVNSKVYIGSTNDITGRFSKHKYLLNKSIHPNDHLQNSWNKYGANSFEFKTLMVCPDKKRNHCEQMFIDLYNAQNRDFGYNIRDADGHSHTEESKQKMSRNNAKVWEGKTFSDEHRQKISESNKGKNKGSKNGRWKKYARIIKKGFTKYGNQEYAIIFNGKHIKYSVYIDSLKKWFYENYPDEELIVDDKA